MPRLKPLLPHFVLNPDLSTLSLSVKLSSFCTDLFDMQRRCHRYLILRFINGINCFGGFETINAIICTVLPKPISSAKIPPTIFFGFLDVDEAVMLL